MAADWLTQCGLPESLDAAAIEALGALRPLSLPARSVLFRPGDDPRGFVLVLEGRIGVYLTGRGGRELLLYSVTPGETCVQTTLGVLGHSAYSGEGITETDCRLVVVPPAVFDRLMAVSEPFRSYVFKGFADRLADVMFVLEQVAFVKVEERLAGQLLDRADNDGIVTATHQDLATAIGSAREVVSRRLEALASRGILAMERGSVRILDRRALKDPHSR